MTVCRVAVPTPVGVNLQILVIDTSQLSRPHARGGEPKQRAIFKHLRTAVPTPVGVNQGVCYASVRGF